MKKNQQSIDGFTPRRRVNNNVQSLEKSQKAKSSERQKIQKKQENTREDILESLKNLEISDDVIADDKKSHKSRRARNKKNQAKRKRFSKKKIIALTIVGIILLGGFFAINHLTRNLGQIFKGNAFDLFKKDKLAQDSLGRTNILVFGTSPDGWDGQDLADSIMLVSLNQDSGKAFTISLPRDLWVKHECSGWLNTTAGKLNESYGCGKISAERAGESKESAEAKGQDEIASSVKQVLGLDVHYKVHANWQVLVQTIDALGGIDVKVEAYDGSPIVYDVATKIRYNSGETVHLNGERALAFSRARGSAGGVGLSGGNFDRERNQQKIIKATVEKINSSGKFDVGFLINGLSALGDNIKTTFKQSEIQTLADLATKFKAENITSLPFVDEKTEINLLKTGNISGASVVIPTAGVFDYGEIQAYISKNTRTDEIATEKAKIVILNGTNIEGLAAEAQRNLTKEGLNITKIDSAPKQDYKNTQIIDLSGGKKPKTIEKIKQKISASTDGSSEKWMEDLDADIVVILGEN